MFLNAASYLRTIQPTQTGRTLYTGSLSDKIHTVSRKSNIPIYTINKNTNDIIKFKKLLKDNIIGQESAINELINIYKKLKLGYKDDKCYLYIKKR